MKTKLAIFLFTSLGVIINMILLTYDRMPSDLLVFLFALCGGICITIASYFNNEFYKGYFWGISSSLLVLFLWYLSGVDYKTIFKDNAPFWVFIITEIIANRTYIESKVTHRKNLIRHSEELLRIMTLYARNAANNTNVGSIDFQLWYIEMEETQKKLKQEILDSNFISDFSFSELWREFREWVDNRTSHNSAIGSGKSFKKYTLCEEMKLAEEIGVTHIEFMQVINSDNQDNEEREFPELDGLQNAINEVKKKYHKDEVICHHNLVERYSN